MTFQRAVVFQPEDASSPIPQGSLLNGITPNYSKTKRMAKEPLIQSTKMVMEAVMVLVIQTRLTITVVGAKPIKRLDKWLKSVCDRLLKMLSKRCSPEATDGVMYPHL